MSTKSYTDRCIKATEKAPADSSDSSIPPGASRYQPHDIPWDRISKPRVTLRTVSKPSLRADNPNLDDLTYQVWRHLCEINQPPFLFRRDGRLTRIEADDSGKPVPVGVDSQRMNYLLVRLFDWLKEKKDELIKSRPPADLATHLVADPDPPVPILRRIVTVPVFVASGQLLDKAGMYADGILYLPPKSFRLRELPSCPTGDDIEAAIAFIRHHLFADFQFVGEPEIANCFAALLTPFVRELIDGPTPLYWVDKSRGGTGGTLLSNIIASPILGAPPASVTAPTDEAEWSRLILSTLLRSPLVFSIDNCNDPLSSAALAHAITARRYEGRIIGSSRNEAANVDCLWLINGNNLSFGWELARRVVRIRIEKTDKVKFIHEHLLSWMIQHRAEIVYNLLVLVKGWHARGCPGPTSATPKFAGFDSWRQIIGGILAACGVSGFLANMDEAREQADQESSAIRFFMQAWESELGLGPIFTTSMLEIARRIFELPEKEHSATIRLGKILSKFENQLHGGLRIQRCPASQGKTQWLLQKIDVQ